MKSATLVEKVSPSSRARIIAVLMFFFTGAHIGHAIDISRAEAKRIGQRIWQNECGGTVAGLTSWNSGENFASLGIGHFIWYPKGEQGPFEESFPPLTAFISARGRQLPDFLLGDRVKECPWRSRTEFLREQNSPLMKQLRRFLTDTIDLQVEFLVARLQNALPKMLAQASDRENVRRQFERVGATPQGCYALVDYVNFKGEGTLATERYHGEGWGLLQVLELMKGPGSQSALDEFADSAKTVLQRRVANSPPARGEGRWLRGWLGRVRSYRQQP
jgi:hypothetical protein